MTPSSCYLLRVSIAPFVLVRFYDHDPICMSAYEKCPVRHKSRAAVHVELCISSSQPIPRAIQISNHPAGVWRHSKGEFLYSDRRTRLRRQFLFKNATKKARVDLSPRYCCAILSPLFMLTGASYFGLSLPPQSRRRTWRRVHIASEVGIQ